MFDRKRNLILDADSYNSSDFLQLPPDARAMSCYIESRGGRFTDVVAAGIGSYLPKIEGPVVDMAMIEEAEAVVGAHGLPFPKADWLHIWRHHGGRLPVEIRAIPEGTVVPVWTPLVVVESTDPMVPWIANYLSETAVLRAVWYPTTVATVAYALRQMMWPYLEAGCDDPATEILFKLHNFGARAASSEESAAIGGVAHLISFAGTDVLGALPLARAVYGATMPALSIPASKHATMTAWGPEGETAAYRNMLTRFARPNAVFSVVSDSYDIDHAVDVIWGRELREAVRDSGATVVIRPDSGDPVLTPIRVIKSLAESYGTTENSKGYRVLNNVRVIQGDGVDAQNIEEILEALAILKLSPTNITFGMGGRLMQADLDRDTLRFASKASAVLRDDKWVPIAKRPKGDAGKASKLGRLAVVRSQYGASTVMTVSTGATLPADDLLRPVFRDGYILQRDTLQRIRARAWPGFEFPE